MRTSVAILGGISVLVVGFFGLAEASRSAGNQPLNGSEADALNATDGVFTGLGQAFAPGIVWLGIAAIVLVFLGYLVAAGQFGR